MIEAKKKAEESDHLKSAFLANVSHEIRTPLNSIVGFSSLLSDEDIDANTRKTYIDLIESNSESLLVLIDEIIDLSKIEARQLTIKKEEFSVDQLILELFQIFKHENKNPEVDFHIEKISDSMELFANSDRVRVKQILINLLTNAFKFTESGTVKMGYIKIDGKVVLFIRDTGIGISEEHHRAIFQRFRKLNEKQYKRIYRGTGLGLAITESLFYGCPIFATPYGAIPELVSNEFGFLSNQEDELAQAIQDAENYSKIKCHEYARDVFNSDEMAKNYVKKYEMVLNQQKLDETPPQLIKIEPKFLDWIQ